MALKSINEIWGDFKWKWLSFFKNGHEKNIYIYVCVCVCVCLFVCVYYGKVYIRTIPSAP